MKLSGKSRLLINVSFYTFALLPIFVIAIFILHYGVNVPTYDQWELVSYLQRFHSHTLGIADLFAQHNEHRLVFPRIIMIGLAQFTHWNMFAEMFASLFIQVVTFVFIWKAITRTLNGVNAKICILFASLCLFNLMQWENWLWGWQIQWYLVILGMVSALYFAWYLPLKQHFVSHGLAMAGATLATFSLAGGMVTWPIILVFSAFRRQIRVFALYLGAFIAELAVYSYHYHSVADHTPLEKVFTNQLDFIRYVCMYVGGSLSNDDQLAPILGATIIAVFLTFAVKALLEKQLKVYFWIGIGTFVLVNAVVTDSGRFLLASDQALASRYTSFSLLLLLSTVIIVFPYVSKSIMHSKPWVQPMSITTLGIFLLIFITNSLNGIPNGKVEKWKDFTAGVCLEEEKIPNSDCFNLIYPSTPANDKQNTAYLEYLRKNHLAGRGTGNY